MENLNPYFKIIENFKLEEYFGILLKDNVANNAPYHNAYHTLCVMKNAYTICINDFLFTDDEIRTILIASLFHDFNHSMGKLTDDINVSNAINKFKQHSKENNNDEIIELIKATQYPYIVENPTDKQKIIRDADMMQIFSDNYFQQNVISLGVEFNKSVYDSCTMSIKFLENLNFYTKYCKDLFKSQIETKINDLNFMLLCLKLY
jgi:hypothetical protein